MANKRIFQIQRAKIGTAAVGGLQQFGFSPSFANVVASTPDGADGVEVVDGSALQIAINLTSTDIKKAVAAVTESTGDLTLEGKESGLATFQEKTLAGVKWLGLALNIPRHADATFDLNGEVRMAAGDALGTIFDTAYECVSTQVEALTPFPQTFPTRLYRPNTAGFTPTGGGTISPDHLDSLTANIAARVNRDDADDDVGVTAIDITGWDPFNVSMTFMDASVDTGRNMAAQLILAASGLLDVQLTGRSGGAVDAESILLNGVKWLTYTESIGAEYATYTMNGQAQWRLSTGTVLSWADTDKILVID